MYTCLKRLFSYFLIFITCIAAYLISKTAIEKKIVEKEIYYTSDTASEVYMVWSLMEGTLPPENLWPSGSYVQDRMIWTKMSGQNKKFSATLKLPIGSYFYYWIVQTKNIQGETTNVWDSGRPERTYYTGFISYGAIFNPGYFIFLAGCLVLLLVYYQNRNHQTIRNGKNFQLNDYIPQFDNIRAIAVLLVIIHHWVPKTSILNYFPNGPLGVNLFFVLSGFLITRILLKAKRQSEELGLKKRTLFRNFYIRRTLRIFPIYYLLLFTLLILNDPDIHNDGIYYFSYLSNYLFYSQEFFPGHVAHLWSLGVEEQFYLIWPWVIVLTNKRILPYIIGLFIIIGISSNYIFTGKGWWVTMLTPACFDAFAIGGFLSWLIAFRQDIITRTQRYYWVFLLIVLTLFILDQYGLSFLPMRTTHSLLAITIMYYCLFKRDNKIVNFVLNNTWLRKLGKISYGVYLYHLFIPELWIWIIQLLNKSGIDPFFNSNLSPGIQPVWLFIQEFLFLIVLSSLSWKFIEKPINNLKSRFENSKSKEGLASEINFRNNLPERNV
ncbi:MAG: acyltransferase, partial [Saprospiraceae bacterium]